ncbi:MAG: hypothetical protein WAU01_00400 [Saprospiraceae bacterium]
MKLQHLITLIFTLATMKLGAQGFRNDSTVFKEMALPISLSYYGNYFIDPGFKIGIERPLFTIQKSRFKKKVKINQHQFFNTLNFGYFFTKEHNHTWFLNTELGYRKTKKSGFKTEILLGVGYLRTFLTDETYDVDRSGNISIIKNAGSNYFMPSISFGVGYDNARNHPNFPMAFSFRPNLFFRYPYNSSVLPQLAVEMNVSYKMMMLRSKSRFTYKSK